MRVTLELKIEGPDAKAAALWLVTEGTGAAVEHAIGGFPENSFVLSAVRVVSASRRLADVEATFELVDPFGNAHLERKDTFFPFADNGSELIEARPRINFRETVPELAELIDAKLSERGEDS